MLAKNVLKSPCKENCSKRCTQNISEEERLIINRSYWNLGGENAKLLFVAQSVTYAPSKQISGNKKVFQPKTKETVVPIKYLLLSVDLVKL